jgi:hypothetical protein
LSKNDPYLTNDLVNELSKKQKIVVLAIGDITCNQKLNKNRSMNTIVTEYISSFYINVRYLKYFFLWLQITFKLFYIRIIHSDIDSIITFAPLFPIAPVIFFINIFKAKKHCIIFDIFPIHQSQIGAIPTSCANILKRVEKFLLTRFDTISGMSPANINFIISYYNLKKQTIFVLPLWGSYKMNKELSEKSNYSEIIRLVFGGQITYGREFDKMVNFLQIMREMKLQVEVDVFSSIEVTEQYSRKFARFNNWLKFFNRINRDEFRQKLSNYDVGLVVTCENVSVPTFPSKIIDYLSAGVKVLGLLERSSDVSAVINKIDAIHINNFDFSENSLKQMKEFLINSKEKLSEKFIEDFRYTYNVKQSADLLNIYLFKNKI